MRSIYKALLFMAALIALGCDTEVEVQKMVNACLDKTNMGQAICECTANLASAELSPLSFRFLTASLGEDEALAKKLKGEMSIDELMAAGMFMANGPARCARAGDS